MPVKSGEMLRFTCSDVIFGVQYPGGVSDFGLGLDMS